MSQINPFIGSILQSPAAQRQAAADRDKQMRRAADSAKNAYLTEDRLELSIESTDKPEETGDEQKRRNEQQKKRKQSDEQPPEESTDRLDITA